MKRFFTIKCVAFLSLISLSNRTSGQIISEYCNAKADSLIKNGIDTVVHYNPYFGPMTQESTDSCMIYERQYLLWKKKDKLSIIQYFEYYNIYKETRGDSIKEYTLFDSLKLFGYLTEHFWRVVTDTLLPAKLRTVKYGKEIIEDYATMRVSDEAYTCITVMVKNRTYTNGFGISYLNDGKKRYPNGVLREKWESINYDYNVSRAIYQLVNRIENQISVLGKFR